MFQIKKSSDDNVWCISSIFQVTQGFEFLILAKTEADAKAIIRKLSDSDLEIPTINDSAYRQDRVYDFLLPTRVYWLKE